jgi:hypothetical protein
MMKRTLLSALNFVSLVLLLVSFSGCGGARPDFEEVIASAIKAADDLQTFRMEGESNRIEKGEHEGTSIWTEFVVPDRIHSISQQLPENGSGEELIQIGTTIYTREINSNEWHVRDWEDEKFIVRNFATDMLYLFAGLADIKVLRDEKIDGVDCFHYTGRMNLKGQQKEQLASFEYARDDVEFWIGKDDYLLWQYKMYIEIAEDEDTEEMEYSSVITTCRFSNFNEPIEIEPPLVEQLEGEE